MLLLQKLHRYTRILFAVITLGSVLMLQGCSGGSDDPAPTYGIGGSVSGLTGTVVLQNNGGSDLTMTADGDFTFGANFANGTSYAVTVLTNPSGQGCTVSNGSGSVNGATVSNIIVTCTLHQDASGIYTGSAELNTTLNKVIPEDLKGMVYNNHFYIFSVNQHVVYDGTIASTNGSNITGTVNVYEDGVRTDNDASMTGFVTEKSQMSLTINGTNKGSASLTLTYNNIYETPATLARIEAPYASRWKGVVKSKVGNNLYFRFEQASDILIGWINEPNNCDIDPNTSYADSFKIPSSVNIYTLADLLVQVDVSPCGIDGVYEGYMTVVDDGGVDKLWVTMINGTNSVFGVLQRM